MEIPAITQIAVVVEDLQTTMEAYHTALGWGPWQIYEFRPPLYRDLRLHGAPADYGVLVAETHVGPIAFELLQPLEGLSPYREWLDEHGEGLHHIACMAPSDAQTLELRGRLADMGASELTSGVAGEDLHFWFIDARRQLKVILETGTGHSQDLITPLRVYPPSA